MKGVMLELLVRTRGICNTSWHVVLQKARQRARDREVLRGKVQE
jgi:hypothetical protein